MKNPLNDFDADIRDHIDRETQDNIARGMAPDEARLAALRKFGNVTRTHEDTRAVWIPVWLDQLKQDVHYAVRSLRRTPGFAAVAILTVAVGIGATTAIFSMVDAILFQPLPFRDSDRIVRVAENFTGLEGRVFQRPMPYKVFLEWSARTKTLRNTIAFSGHPMLVRVGDTTARLWGASASAEMFTRLGTRAALGRTLAPGDADNPDVIVLGFGAWRRVFRSDPGIVGQTMQIGAAAGGRVLTIVGVLPADFEFLTNDGARDFYRPLNISGAGSQVTMLGWLREGVSLRAAADEANVIGSALRPPVPASAPPLTVPRFDVALLKEEIVEELQPALRVLLVAVAMVLLIVCANVANLLLSRGAARQREIAVRAAIGAGRGRLARQVVAECAVLALAGGILGTLLAAGGITLVRRLTTVEAPGIFSMLFGSTILPRGHEIDIDLRMLGIACGVSAIACGVFGLLPAVRLSRTNLARDLGARGSSAARGESRFRAALVVGQLAMATLLLVAAGLLTNSLIKLTTVEKGYDARHVLAVQLVFPDGYPFARRADTIDRVLAGLRAQPEVEAAGFSRAGVLIGEEIVLGTWVPQGRTIEEMRAQRIRPRVRTVSEGFLPAMGIRFMGGSDLAAGETSAPPSIVLNRLAAVQLFGQRRAVGELVDWHFDKLTVQVRVAGVVEELRNASLEQEPFPEVFVHYRYLRDLLERVGDSVVMQNQRSLGLLSFAVRTTGDPALAIPAATSVIRSVDPNAGIDAMVPLERLVSGSIARPRFYAVVLAVFAGVAAFLAAIGVYGVLAYTVVQRTKEIGLRMALGAQRRQVLSFVLRNGLIMGATGITLGLAAAAMGTRLLETMLFGVTPLDPTTFLAVACGFALVAVLASYWPARRATRVDPVVALRAE